MPAPNRTAVRYQADVQRLRAALLLAAAVFGLYLSVPSEGLGAVVDAASEANPSSLAVAAALLCGVIAARIVRFQVLLADARPSWSDQLTASGVGFFALQLLPFRLGEFVRPHLLAEAGVPWGRSLGAIALERLLDLVALLVLVVLSGSVELPGVLHVGGFDVLQTAQRAVGAAVAFGIVVMGAALAAGAPFLVRLQRVPAIGPPIASLLGHALAGLAATRAPLAAGAAALTAWVWGSNTAIVAVLLHGFPDLPTGFAPAVLTTTATTAGILAVPTPGMVGSFEAFATRALALWPGDRGSAAAFALSWHGLTLALHALLGASLLAARGLSLGDVVRASRAAPETPS